MRNSSVVRFKRDQIAHPCHQGDIADRLGQKIVCADLKPLDAVAQLVERRNHDDRNMGGSQVRLETLARLETV